MAIDIEDDGLIGQSVNHVRVPDFLKKRFSHGAAFPFQKSAAAIRGRPPDAPT
jgi:hypothetical protein